MRGSPVRSCAAATWRFRRASRADVPACSSRLPLDGQERRSPVRTGANAAAVDDETNVEGHGRARLDPVARDHPLLGYVLRDPDERVVALGVLGEQLVRVGYDDEVARGGQPFEIGEELLEGIPVAAAARGELERSRQLEQEPILGPGAAAIDGPRRETGRHAERGLGLVPAIEDDQMHPGWVGGVKRVHGRSVHRRERLIVIARIVRLPRPLLDHYALRSAVLPRPLRIDVVLTIVAVRQPALSIAEHTPAHVPRQRLPVPLLDLCEDLAGLLGDLGLARGPARRLGGRPLPCRGRRESLPEQEQDQNPEGDGAPDGPMAPAVYHICVVLAGSLLELARVAHSLTAASTR